MEEIQQKNTKLKILLPVVYYVCCFLAIIILDLLSKQKFSFMLDFTLTLLGMICLMSIVTYAYLFSIRWQDIIIFGLLFGAFTGAWILVFPWYFKIYPTCDLEGKRGNPNVIVTCQLIYYLVPIILTYCSLAINQILWQKRTIKENADEKSGLFQMFRAFSVGTLVCGAISVIVLLAHVIVSYFDDPIWLPSYQEIIYPLSIGTAGWFGFAFICWLVSQFFKNDKNKSVQPV